MAEAVKKIARQAVLESVQKSTCNHHQRNGSNFVWAIHDNIKIATGFPQVSTVAHQ